MPVQREDRGSVTVLSIDNPKKMNALSVEILRELEALIVAIEADSSVRAVVITGAEGGKFAFAAGADIGFMQDAQIDAVREFAELGHRVTARLESLPKPVIAAIRGFALGGGCELALACDIRIAADSARLGQPEVNLGIMPGWGGTQRLAWITTPGFAKELIFSARHVKAEEAHARGLVDHVYPDDEVVEKAVELAELIATKAPLAVGRAKQLINTTAGGDAAARLVAERDAFVDLFSTEDQTEGMSAFFEKRSPTFRGV